MRAQAAPLTSRYCPAGVRDEERDGRRGEVGAVEVPALPQGLRRPQPLDRARQVAGQHAQQPLVRLREGPEARALRVEDPQDARADLERHADLRAHLGVEGHVVGVPGGVVHPPRDPARRHRTHDPGTEADRRQLVGRAARAERPRVVEEAGLRVQQQEAAVAGEEGLVEKTRRAREERLLVGRRCRRLGHPRDDPLLGQVAPEVLLDPLQVGHVHERSAQTRAAARGRPPRPGRAPRASAPRRRATRPATARGAPRRGACHRPRHGRLEGRPVVRVDVLQDVRQAGLPLRGAATRAEEPAGLVRPPHRAGLGVHLPDGHPRRAQRQGEPLLAPERAALGLVAGQAAAQAAYERAHEASGATPRARAHDRHRPEADLDHRPAGLVVLGRDLASVVVHDPLDDREAEPRAPAPPGEERLEEARQVGRVEAGPGVPHRALDPALLAVPGRSERHLHPPALGREVDRVLDEVLQDLGHARPVGEHGESRRPPQPGDLDRLPPRQGRAGGHRRLHHLLHAALRRSRGGWGARSRGGRA